MREYHGQNGSVTERLSALRTPPPHVPPQEIPSPSSKIAIRKELFIGGIVLLAVIAIAIPVVTRNQQPQLVDSAQALTDGLVESTSSESTTNTKTPVDQSGLESGEAYVAIPIESGHFPPRLAAGHIVRVSITTSRDGSSATESLPETATVQSVEPISEVGTNFVVTVLASENLVDKVAGSESVDLAIVGQVAK